MQNMDCFSNNLHIDHPKSSCTSGNPNLAHTDTDRLHGFPVVRLEPTLNAIQLVARQLFCTFRPASEYVQAVALKNNLL